MERKQLDNAIVYIGDDYKSKKEVNDDVNEGNRVVIISKEDDVLSFYGLILEQYGQYNVYKVDDYNDVDNEFLEAVSIQDQTKDEAILYVGKPLSQLVSETIDSLQLDPKQKRLMSICKEILKGTGNDIKTEAALELANKRFRQAQAEKENLKAELDSIKTTQEGLLTSSQYVKNTVSLDGLFSKTQVMYIREYTKVPYLQSCIKAYCNYLNQLCKKRAKICIFDNKLFNIKYKNIQKIDSAETFSGNRALYTKADDLIVCNQIYPIIINELYKNSFDILIIVDRVLNEQDIIKGKNVHKFYATNDEEILDYLEKKDIQDFTYILGNNLKKTDNTIKIADIKTKDLSTPQQRMFWYSKLGNCGEDKRKIFDIFNEKNEPILGNGVRR